MTDQIVDKVDNRTTHINERQIVYQDGGTVPLDGVVVLVALIGQIESIGKTGTAATLHGDT